MTYFSLSHRVSDEAPGRIASRCLSTRSASIVLPSGGPPGVPRRNIIGSYAARDSSSSPSLVMVIFIDHLENFTLDLIIIIVRRIDCFLLRSLSLCLAVILTPGWLVSRLAPGGIVVSKSTAALDGPCEANSSVFNGTKRPEAEKGVVRLHVASTSLRHPGESMFCFAFSLSFRLT